MSSTRRYQADCANTSSSSFNGTQMLLSWLSDVVSCPFWNIVHNEVSFHISMVLGVTFLSLIVNMYLLRHQMPSLAASWRPRSILLRNLIASDLLQSLTFTPAMLHCLLYRQSLSWNLIQFFTATLAIITSLLTVTSMSLERLVYNCHGSYYFTIMTDTRVYTFMTLIWLLAALVAGTSTVMVLAGRGQFSQVISGFVCLPEVVQAPIEQPMYFDKFNNVFIVSLLSFCVLVFVFSYIRMYREACWVKYPFQQDIISARGTVALYFGIFILQLLPGTVKFISVFDKDMENHLLLAVLLLVPPFVKPLLYSMGNTEVWLALKRFCRL